MTSPDDIDARGLRCPLPVLRLAKALREAPQGALFRLLATDAMAAIDVPHFCNESGNTLIEALEVEGGMQFLVRRD